MNKEIINKFVNKYTLGGCVESVTWKISNNELSTKFLTEDKSVMGTVTLKNFKETDNEFHVYETSRLKTLLNVLSDEIKINVTNIADKNTSIVFSDNDTNVNFVLADSSAIPSVPNLKSLPTFEVEIPFSKEFISKFIKAKNALSEVDTFTLIKKKDKLQFILGYSASINSNKIILDVEPTVGKDSIDNPISFSSKYLKEILTSNNQCESALLKVSTKGLATIEFSHDDFSSKYYLVEIKMSE